MNKIISYGIELDPQKAFEAVMRVARRAEEDAAFLKALIRESGLFMTPSQFDSLHADFVAKRGKFAKRQ